MKATKATRSARNRKLGTRPTRSGHTAKLRIDNFDAEMKRLGFTSNLEMAHFLGLGEGTVSRLRTGKGDPGIAVVLALAKRFGYAKLAELIDGGNGGTVDPEMRAAA